MRINEIIKIADDKLNSIEFVDTKREAYEIISYIIDIDRSDLMTRDDLEIDSKNTEEILEIIEKRSKGIPLQYILKRAYFYDREFYVDNRVLIPRYDTEHLFYRSLELSKKFSNPKLLEIGAGSGAVSISLFLENNDLSIDAVDISEDALSVCNINNKKHSSNVNFFKSDLFNNVDNKYDIIISNPPYIKKDDLKTIPKETLEEPILALDGGIDGLDYYRIISKDALEYLNSGGYIIFEIGFNQSIEVYEILDKLGYKDIKIYKDFQNFNRVIYAIKE